MTMDDFENKLVALILAAAKSKLPPDEVARILTEQAGSVIENAATQKE